MKLTRLSCALVASAHTGGIKRGPGLVANQKPAYAPPMPFEDTVKTVAKAIGFNGRCSDYLFDTLAGIKDMAFMTLRWRN